MISLFLCHGNGQWIKINSHLRSYSSLPLPFPAACIDSLSSQGHYQSCCSLALFEKELWWWVQFLRKVSSVSSLLFWETNQGHYPIGGGVQGFSGEVYSPLPWLSLQWKLQCLSLQVWSLQLSCLGEPEKEKGNLLWGRNRNMTIFSWRHFRRCFPDHPLTFNYLEIVNRSVASCPNSAHVSAPPHKIFFICIRHWIFSSH